MALMGLWDQSCDIEQLDRDEPSASFTGCVVRLARTTELFVGAILPNEGNAPVRLNCREWIVGDLDWGEGTSSEEGRLANVRFPDDPQLHKGTNVMLPQVPLWPGPNDGRGTSEGYVRTPLRGRRRRAEIRITSTPPISAGPPKSENSGIGTVSE